MREAGYDPFRTCQVHHKLGGCTGENYMQRLGTFLHLGFALFIAGALVHESAAQTASAPSKAATRLITLGTVAGPPPRANRAQSSNLLIVNGTLYVVDAGDGATRRIAQAAFNVRDV